MFIDGEAFISIVKHLFLCDIVFARKLHIHVYSQDFIKSLQIKGVGCKVLKKYFKLIFHEAQAIINSS